jgi:NIMA (never in mitosis gene a)-related kinase
MPEQKSPKAVAAAPPDVSLSEDGGPAGSGQLAKYEIMRRIGSGKFSVVYKARRHEDSSICALKKVQVFDIKDAKAREKCLKEVKLLEALHHENIVRYHDSFFEESVLFIVFEWAAGGDLKKVIREAAGADKPGSKPSRLDEAVIWSYFSQMAEGLRYMHDLRMMHRDMKPANVFINGNGKLKLGDMGLGRQLSEDSVAAFSKVGTPLYMSPEVLKGDGYDMQSDLWSLGCILYEMANLRSPFKTDDQNLYALFQRITACEYPPVRGCPPHTSSASSPFPRASPARVEELSVSRSHCSRRQVHESYSEQLHVLVGRMVQLDPAARPLTDEVCEIAAGMTRRCMSVRHPQLVAEDLSFKLQLLDYERRWCARTRRHPLSRLHFALPSGGGLGGAEKQSTASGTAGAPPPPLSARPTMLCAHRSLPGTLKQPTLGAGPQFWDFVELGWWLQAVVCGRGEGTEALLDRGRYGEAVPPLHPPSLPRAALPGADGRGWGRGGWQPSRIFWTPAREPEWTRSRRCHRGCGRGTAQRPAVCWLGWQTQR